MKKPAWRDHDVLKKCEEINSQNLDYKAIPLTQGHITIVDSEYYDYLNQWNWFPITIRKNGCYVCRKLRRNSKRIHISMHRFIWEKVNGNIPKELVVDHINRKPYDNRIINLRVVTSSQNSSNKTKKEDTSSKYIGVRRVQTLWRSQINIEYKKISLGIFESEEDAALAFDLKARERGELEKNLNFPNVLLSEEKIRFLKSKHKLSGCKSNYLGVTLCKQMNRYTARIAYNKARYFIGYFNDEIEAAKAYDKKARELGIPEHKLNFPILPT